MREMERRGARFGSLRVRESVSHVTIAVQMTLTLHFATKSNVKADDGRITIS